MKRIIFPILLALTLGFVSCDDFLTEDARGVENLDTYFQNEEEATSFINGCYATLVYDDWWQIYNPWLLADIVSDDLWAGNTTGQTSDYENLEFFLPTAPTNGILSNLWQYRYKGIANCNIAINRIKNTPMDETRKNSLIAQARFIRAFMYFDLVKYFGGVPMVTELLAPDQLSGIERSTEEQVYAFIESELAEVAEILPQQNQLSSDEVGHATRGAALGFLGKAYLYQAKWDDAKKTLKKVIDEGQYELLDNFGDVWAVSHNNSRESIFEIQTMYNGNLYNTGSSLSVVTGCRNGVGDGWAWGQPTSDLENAFIAAGDTERLRWSIIKTGCTEIAGEDRFNEFIENNEANVGKSLFATYKEDFGWSDDMFTTTYIIKPNEHKSARVIRKFFIPLNERPAIYDKQKLPLNYRVLRYADILLMYAEACNETSDDGNARTSLNEVRHRVGLSDVRSSGNELRDAIRLERRLELAFENQRLFDLRRWDCDNGKKMMANVFGQNGTFVKYNLGPDADIYEKNNQKESSTKGQNFREDRDLIFPIPIYEIQNSNGSIKQNPNY